MVKYAVHFKCINIIDNSVYKQSTQLKKLHMKTKNIK